LQGRLECCERMARLWVARLKNSLSVEHPIAGDELRAIKRRLTPPEGSDTPMTETRLQDLIVPEHIN